MEEYIIDGQVFHGSSGSPVFIVPEIMNGRQNNRREFKFIGVLTQTLVRNFLERKVEKVNILCKNESQNIHKSTLRNMIDMVLNQIQEHIGLGHIIILNGHW